MEFCKNIIHQYHEASLLLLLFTQIVFDSTQFNVYKLDNCSDC